MAKAGHSKGGAVASIAGYDLIRQGQPVRRVVTFGSMPVFDRIRPGLKEPIMPIEETLSDPVLNQLAIASTHYFVDTDVTDFVAGWLIRALNVGEKRIVYTNAHVKTDMRGGRGAERHQLGSTNPLASVDQPFSLTNHDLNTYLYLLRGARDFSYPPATEVLMPSP
jgi:hypothetical protein